jgi:protein-disulfide isomerase
VNKKGILIGIMTSIVIISVLVVYSSSSVETENLDVRTHGMISTAMGSSILGNPSAQITIVEFGDYQCHQCYNWFHNTKPAVFQNYVDTGKVNFIFMDLAFLGVDSPKAAQASYCAEDQGKYWEYHNQLYTAQESQIDNGWANSERLKAFAFSLDLDIELFDSCLDSGKYVKRVQHNIAEAKKLGANGTPTFFIISIDGQQQKLVGAQPYSVFKQVLDSMI